MKPCIRNVDDVDWKDWEDPLHGTLRGVRWAEVMSAGGRLALGAMEIGPGEALPWHHHAAEEIYHVITGTGRLTVDGEVHQLKPGTTAFIPADAWHLTEAHRRGRLRVLFFFPDRPLREVDYHFDPTDRLAA